MKRIIATSLAVAALSLGLFGCSSTGTTGSATPTRTIVFVWDGLRPVSRILRPRLPA